MTTPILIEGSEYNLSTAWTEVLRRITNDPGRTEISPLIISLTDFSETNKIRQIIDSNLEDSKLPEIRTVSETIFPKSLYQLSDKNRFALYDEYINNLPRIKSINKKANGKGTYFERMIAFDDANNNTINQIEIIISSLNGKTSPRRSKLQISIFDPRKDHTEGKYQGFPCLQHLTFYKSKNNGLILNCFYAVQYLYRRGYGNWLGLINLGKFIANELHLEFERFNCYVGVESLDNLTKAKAKVILKDIDKQ